MLVEVTAVQRSPPLVGPPCHVRHKNMGVEMRVAGPAAAMPERGCDEPVTDNLVDAVSAAPRPTRGAFQIAQRRANGSVVRGTDLCRHIEAAEAEQDRHRLRRLEREIEPRDVICPDPTQPDTGLRVTALKHRE